MAWTIFFIILAVFFSFQRWKDKKRAKTELELKDNSPKSEGEILNNPYIIKHEQKLKDDALYQEYLDWCKSKGELPADKEGFDEYRMKEYVLYRNLKKFGINRPKE